MSDCNNCEFKCLCNSENNCIGWSGKSPLKKVCDTSYQQGKEDVIEIIEEAKNECLHYFQDLNFYYNDCRMKESLESFWNGVIDKLKEQKNE